MENRCNPSDRERLYQQTQAILVNIHQLLVELEMWSKQAPSNEAMASTAPFACDLMPLEHWLQYLFLPKMQALIDHEFPLPTQIAIAPMAQHVWQGQVSMQPLITKLNELDNLLNDTK